MFLKSDLDVIPYRLSIFIILSTCFCEEYFDDFPFDNDVVYCFFFWLVSSSCYFLIIFGLINQDFFNPEIYKPLD